MIKYVNESPVIAIVPPEHLKDRLDTFFYHPLFKDLDNKITAHTKNLTDIDSISKFVTDGTHQTPTYVEKENDGVLFLSATNIMEDGLCLEKVKFIPRSLHESYSNCQPLFNDVMVAKNGKTGVACVFPEGVPECSIYVSIALIRLKPGWLPEFIALVINSELGFLQIQRNQKGIGVKNLHLEDIRQIQIPLIEKNEQRYILDRYEQLEEQISSIYEEAKKYHFRRAYQFDKIVDLLAFEIGLSEFPSPWFGRLYFQKAELEIDRLDVLGANSQFEDECWKSGKFVPLSEVCEVDGSNEQIPLGTQRYISIDSLPGNYWGDIDLPEMEIENKTGRTHFYPGDIAWAHLKPSILQGKAYIIQDECWGSHHFLKLNTSKVSEDLRTIIWAYLKIRPIKRHLANKCTGKSESQKDVSDKALGMLPFPHMNDDQIERVASDIRNIIEKSYEFEVQENEYGKKTNDLLKKAKTNIFNLLNDKWFNDLVNEAKEALQ